jgi:hypothetical protein
MSLTSWDAWCWMIGVLGFIVLTFVLIYKKRYKVFPWFTGLLIFEIIQTGILFFVHHSGWSGLYFGVYWIGEIIEVVIRVGVMFELARITARHLGDKERRQVRPLLWTLVIAFSVCVWVIFREHGLADPVVTFAVKVSICTSVLAGFLALAFALITAFDGIRVRVYSQAVTYGLVIYFSGKLIAELALLLHEHGWWVAVQNGLKPVYILCLFIWAGVFWFEEPRQVLNDEMDKWRRYGVALDERVKMGSGSYRTDFRTSLIEDPSVRLKLGPKIVEQRSKVEHNSPILRDR